MKTLVKQFFKFEDEILQSEAVVEGTVIVMENKVVTINNGKIKLGEDSFSFSTYTDPSGKMILNLSGIASDINGSAYIEEFVRAVENGL